MNTPICKVLHALRELDCKPCGGSGQWSARCPSHSDRTPSLSIGQGDDGRVLMRCHAGCSCKEILDAMGLSYRDLHVNDSGKKWRRLADRSSTQPNRAFRTHSKNRRIFTTELAAISSLSCKLGKPSKLWRYLDVNGDHVGSVVRWATQPGQKVIRPLALTPAGWAISAMTPPRPILHADYIAAMPPGSAVHVHEGEVAADAGWSVGLVSTTAAGGANGAHLTNWAILRDKEVVVWPDLDESGQQYAEVVADRATNAGADSVRVMDIRDLVPTAGTGADFADFVNQSSGLEVQP